MFLRERDDLQAIEQILCLIQAGWSVRNLFVAERRRALHLESTLYRRITPGAWWPFRALRVSSTRSASRATIS